MNKYKITFCTPNGTESECFFNAVSIEEALSVLSYVYEGWTMKAYEIVK